MDQLLTDFGPIFRCQRMSKLCLLAFDVVYTQSLILAHKLIANYQQPEADSPQLTANSLQSTANGQKPTASSSQPKANSTHTHPTANSTRPVRLCVCMHVRKYLSTSLFPHVLTSPACRYVHMSSKTSALIRTCIFIRQSSHTSLSTTLTPSSLLLLASTLLR